MSDAPAALLRLEHVSRTYANHVSVRAVDDVSLTLARGAFAALAGPSGSGKTTLLNLVGGLDRPDGGRIRIGDAEVTSMSAGALADFRLVHVGFVFQAFNLFPVLTVLRTWSSSPRFGGRQPPREDAGQGPTFAGRPGWSRLKRPNELSGGHSNASRWRARF